MGLGLNKKELFPKKIMLILDKIKSVSAGNNHSLLLTVDGVVYSTGLND